MEMRWAGALIGAWAGLRALEEIRKRRRPCGICRAAERTGLAPIVAAGVGALAGYLVTDELAGVIRSVQAKMVPRDR